MASTTNRNGREDFAVSHLDALLALLTNTSPRTGSALVLHLRGTESARDAIGTVVTATVNGRTQTRQLTAGGGYLALNQRRLVFGLGPAGRVDELTIRWPSGRTARWTDLPAGAELLTIESRPQPLRIGS